MKTNPFAVVSAAVISASVLAPTRSSAASGGQAAPTIPAVPVGELSATPKSVQTGTKPTLAWEILYPSKIGDLAAVIPPGTLVPNQSTYVSVQIVGTGDDNPTDARVSLNGGPYRQLFYGTQADVDPSAVLYVHQVGANQAIDFGGRFVENGQWSPFYTTRSANSQVVVLVNGDTPPNAFPLYQSPTLASYLKPYLDSTGKVKIGPLSALILMELQQTNHSLASFDRQDQVLLVTMSKKGNQGHGNNIDGVDVSNPGQGKGGPTGAVDPSGGIDDEMR